MCTRLRWLVFTILVLALLAQQSFAICMGEAMIAANPTEDPESPDWTYTLTITWTYVVGIDHWVIPLDAVGGTCVCENLQEAILILDPAGDSNGEPDGCTVSYLGQLECQGDPNSDWVGPCLTFTPIDPENCAPPSAGTAVFRFQSDAPPVVLVDAWFFAANPSAQTCAMGLGGVFPGLACDPAAAENRSWGSIKGMYR